MSRFKGLDLDNLAVTAEDVRRITDHILESVTSLLAQHAADVIGDDRDPNEGSLIIESATLTTGAGENKAKRPYLFVFSQGVGSELYSWIFKAISDEITENPERLSAFLAPHFAKLTEAESAELFAFRDVYEKSLAEEEFKVSDSDRRVMAEYLSLVEEPEGDAEEGEDGIPFTPPTKPTIN